MSAYLIAALSGLPILIVCWIALGRDLGRKLDMLSINDNNDTRKHDA